VAGPEGYVPTTVGGGCFLGVSVVAAADTAALETGGWGVCAGSSGPRASLRADFTPAYDCLQAHRPSNAVDRLLYAMRYCHATTASARLAVRAMGRQWNFHPYGSRRRRTQPSWVSPFHDLNSFQYHPNWLHNFLIASSQGA
jgi:hypothetical protein